MIDETELDSVIEFLEGYNKVEFTPYPDYEGGVYAALGMLKPDKEYSSHYKKLKGKPIEKMNRREIATMLTFISRGERFCDGHIASYVESGELLKLMLRLKELNGKWCFIKKRAKDEKNRRIDK